MPGPQHGALGASYTVSRGLQLVCLIAIIGMTANFVAQMVAAEQKPADVMLGTLSVTCIAVLYIVLTYILYWDAHLPFLVSAACDSTLLIAVIVVAVTVGRPLSYLECAALPSSGGDSSAFLKSIGQNLAKANYWVWAGANSTSCYEMKAIWGLAISLCILFAFSAVVSGLLWKRLRVVPGKEIV